MAATNSATH